MASNVKYRKYRYWFCKDEDLSRLGKPQSLFAMGRIGALNKAVSISADTKKPLVLDLRDGWYVSVWPDGSLGRVEMDD